MIVRKLGRQILILLLLIFISNAIMLFIPIKQALVFEYQNTGKVLAYIPFSKEKNFKIKYTHSIHLSDVVESYTVTKEKRIKQYELMYEDFAIGMPENAFDGEIFEQKDGKYYIKNMKRIFPLFDLRIGKVRANHRVIYKNKEYQLADYLEAGTWVRIKIKKISLFQQLKGVNILEQ
ncbi:DUF1850 domain-containing protein [Cytobacillus solani]|uniref:DUF1850 domain-containing protein n=1 Tax=Cytobacillus solani TaxID=1637975 RepID=UPI00114F6119|nr:DUF1850 domain-containing protein [Cytobacillus solani]USK56697.1 DUF1850 domain-containing protein [Cytobacillus solani]